MLLGGVGAAVWIMLAGIGGVWWEKTQEEAPTATAMATAVAPPTANPIPFATPLPENVAFPQLTATAVAVATYPDPTTLLSLALHRNDIFPLQVETWQSDGFITPTSANHPLQINRLPLANAASTPNPLLAYEEGYQSTATLNWKGQTFFMMNYFYRYPSGEDADQALGLIYQAWGNPPFTMLATLDEGQLHGQIFSLQLNQDDFINGFVGTSQDTLIILLVNALSPSTGEESFRILLNALLPSLK